MDPVRDLFDRFDVRIAQARSRGDKISDRWHTQETFRDARFAEAREVYTDLARALSPAPPAATATGESEAAELREIATTIASIVGVDMPTGYLDEEIGKLFALADRLAPRTAGYATEDDGLTFLHYAAPAPAGTTDNHWQCGNCDAPPVTTSGHVPPMQCPGCGWVDGAWKWLGSGEAPRTAGTDGTTEGGEL